MAEGAPALLEPVMAIEVVVPEEYIGDVIGHINSKRGEVNQMEMRGQSQFVHAAIPLSSTFGYATGCAPRLRVRNVHDAVFTTLYRWRTKHSAE